MNYKFLRESVQEQYLKYQDKTTKQSFNSYLPFFVKLNKDFQWYFEDFLERPQDEILKFSGDNEILYELPLLLFIYISNADNVIEESEFNAFIFVMNKFSEIYLYKDFIAESTKLHENSFEEIKRLQYSESELRNKLIFINQILSSINTDKKIKILNLIKKMIYSIAEATGSLFSSHKINEYETKIINDISEIFTLNILSDQNSLVIGSGKNCDIVLNPNKNILTKHLSVTLYENTILLRKIVNTASVKLNNKELLEELPYVMEEYDILFLGEYVVTFAELLYFYNYHQDEHLYHINKLSNKLSQDYIYRLKSDGIYINDNNLKHINKFDYFDILTLENYIIYYGTLLEGNNNNHILFENNIIYLSLYNNIELRESNQYNAIVTITKESNSFQIESKIDLYCQGELITLNNKYQDEVQFYFKNIRCQLSSQGLSIKTLKSFDINIKNLNINYEDATIIENMNIDINSSDMVCIMGPSGCGKSTLLDSISYPKAMKKANITGSIIYNGRNLFSSYHDIGPKIGFVSQDDVLYSNLTIFENLKYYMLINGIEYDKYFIESILDDIGLLSKKDLYAGDIKDRVLSGGQRKRLNIALEFIKSPQILFLDEPTSGLSSKDSESIIEMLKELSNIGITTISVIHQPSSFIFNSFNKFLFLIEGNIAYYGNTKNAYKYFSTFDEYIDTGCDSPELFFNIAEAIELDENGYEVRLEKNGHLFEKKHKYSSKYLKTKFDRYKKDMYNV